MATSAKQDAAFRDSLIPNNLLEDALEWIRSNMSPEDVFEKELLVGIGDNYSPDDVFSDKKLAEWAEDNGYKKED